MSDSAPAVATVVVVTDTSGAPSAPPAEIVVEPTSAAGTAKVVVVQTSVARTRPSPRSWLEWLRSLIEGIVAFVKALVPLVAAAV